jgi:hypothetical protein
LSKRSTGGGGASAHGWIRGNVLGLVAILIALSGTAVATQVADSGPRGATAKKKAKKKAKRGPRGPQGLQGPAGPQGAVGPSTGAAGGDLTGSFPNPQLGPGVVGTPEIGTIPAARATAINGLPQTIPDSVATTIALGSEAAVDGGFDTAGMHDNAVNNSRLTAPVDGVYLLGAEVAWGSNSVGLRQISIVSPALGQPVASDRREPVGVNTVFQSVSGVAQLAAGDYVELQVLQTSGGSRSSVADGFEFPFLSMVWLGP